MTESIAVNNTRNMAELVEIKEEPDIKLEPDDEVDTIEYEQPLNQLVDKCILKVEKTDPDGNGDEARAVFHRSGHFVLINFNARNRYARTGMEPVDNEQPCSSQMGNTMEKPRGRSTVDGKKALNAGKSSRKQTQMTKKTNNRRSSQKKEHKCKDCGYVTTCPSNLKVHMRKHTGERPFPCKSCDKRFNQKSVLQRHMKVHVNKDSVHCPGCWQIFATKEEKFIHESMCKRRRYECFLCQAFSTMKISDLKGHLRIHSGVRPFQCAQCSMKFTQKINLKIHLKTHSRQPKPRCSVCAQNFLKESEKDAHEINCNRRRYECHLCQSYMTDQKLSLQYHMRMHHTGERSFKCNSCEKCYAMESHLKCHIKRTHKH